MSNNFRVTNDDTTSTLEISEQLKEPRPLPMGRQEFEEWSDRIIAGALLPPTKEDPQVFIDSQKAVLASMILHLGPTESHKPDAYFIHSLRKAAVNQVAHTIGEELRAKAKERLALEETIRKTHEINKAFKGSGAEDVLPKDRDIER